MKAAERRARSYHPWTTYIFAREEARARGDRRVGTEHIFIGLLHDPAIETLLNVSLEDARRALKALDAGALDALGIAVEPSGEPEVIINAPAKPTFRDVMINRLPMTPTAKSVLESTGRPMRRGREVSPKEVMARLLALRAHDPCDDLIAHLGLDKAGILERLAASASGS